MDPLVLLVDLLCVYRLARLVTKDSLLNAPRWWILRRWPSELTTFPSNLVIEQATVDEITVGVLAESRLPVYLDEEGWKAEEPHKITELIECAFCCSVWLSFAVMAVNPWQGWTFYILTSLGLAGGVALIFTKWDNE